MATTTKAKNYNFTAVSLRPCEEVEVYTGASFSENPSQLDMVEIISSLLYMIKKYSPLDDVGFAKEFQTFISVPIPQPADQVQAAVFNKIEPFLFCYLVTMIPQNHNDKFMDYQLSKVKGLSRVVEAFIEIEEENYIFDEMELKALRAFCDRHPKILKRSIHVLLGFASPDNESMVTAFAQQMLKSIKYSYMLGVELIEDYLVAPGDPCLSFLQVNAYMSDYYRFKDKCVEDFGDTGWRYAAVMDRSVTNDYLGSIGYKFLYILSACVASEVRASFKKTIIDDFKVVDHIISEPYKSIMSQREKLSTGIIVENKALGKHTSQELRDKLNIWSNNPRGGIIGRTVNSSTHANEEMSSMNNNN